MPAARARARAPSRAPGSSGSSSPRPARNGGRARPAIASSASLEPGARDLVLDAARGRRVPVEPERRVDRLERRAQQRPSRRRRARRRRGRRRVISRWPIPASLTAPRALTLQAPGQYSPGTSPTRASTPSARSAAATIPATSSKRSRGAGDRALPPGSPRRTRVCPRERRPPARRRAARTGSNPASRGPRATAASNPGAARSCFEKASSRAGRWRRKVGRQLAGRDPAQDRLRDRRSRRRGGRGNPAGSASVVFWTVSVFLHV